MANQEKVKSIVQDLMERLYDAKGFTDLKCNPLERNLFETEMQEIWKEFETHVVLCHDDREEYEEEIEDLKERLSMTENDNTDLINRNYDLAGENQKLWNRIEKISKVVNDTWC